MNNPALLDEDLVLLRDGPRKLGRKGWRPSLDNLQDWCSLGIKVGESTVCLDWVKVGGKRATSRQAFARFLAAIQPEATENSLEGFLRQQTIKEPMVRGLDRKSTEA